MQSLIPAGTGLPNYKHLDIQVDSPADEVQNMEDALAATHAGDPSALQSPTSASRAESGA